MPDQGNQRWKALEKAFCCTLKGWPETSIAI